MNALTPMTAYRTVQTPAVGKPKEPVSAAVKSNLQRIAFLMAGGMTHEEAYASLLSKDRRRVVDAAAQRTAIGSPQSFNPENGSIGGITRAARGHTTAGMACTIEGVCYPSIKAAARGTRMSEHKIKKILAGNPPSIRFTRPCIVLGRRFATVAIAAAELKMSRTTIRARIEAGCAGYAWVENGPKRAK